jgi:NitT/TauT family transport system permease protein
VSHRAWFQPFGELTSKQRLLLTACAFALPLAIWCALSYVPFLWHPMMKITAPGGVSYFEPGQLVEKETFRAENAKLKESGGALAAGTPANPVFLPAPHEVAQAFYKAFTTEPKRRGEPWLHESIAHSIKIIGWGFFWSALAGVPLGILCGTLAVAVFGIYDAPKVTIIFIGTFFQMVLVVANTTRKMDRSLLEAAQTLGASRKQLVTKVVLPGIMVDLYNDMRILLGWAWTYLIVAEYIGASSGITYFINQQAKYRIYDNVFAAIAMIGIIGLTTDIVLAWLGRMMFPWQPNSRRNVFAAVFSLLKNGRKPSLPIREQAEPTSQ